MQCDVYVENSEKNDVSAWHHQIAREVSQRNRVPPLSGKLFSSSRGNSSNFREPHIHTTLFKHYTHDMLRFFKSQMREIYTRQTTTVHGLGKFAVRVTVWAACEVC
eukprot:1193727-Prorocentrum_minimum.AAC.8